MSSWRLACCCDVTAFLISLPPLVVEWDWTGEEGEGEVCWRIIGRALVDIGRAGVVCGLGVLHLPTSSLATGMRRDACRMGNGDT